MPTCLIGAVPSHMSPSIRLASLSINAVTSVGPDIWHCFWATLKSVNFMNIDTHEHLNPWRLSLCATVHATLNISLSNSSGLTMSFAKVRSTLMLFAS